MNAELDKLKKIVTRMETENAELETDLKTIGEILWHVTAMEYPTRSNQNNIYHLDKIWPMLPQIRNKKIRKKILRRMETNASHAKIYNRECADYEGEKGV